MLTVTLTVTHTVTLAVTLTDLSAYCPPPRRRHDSINRCMHAKAGTRIPSAPRAAGRMPRARGWAARGP